MHGPHNPVPFVRAIKLMKRLSLYLFLILLTLQTPSQADDIRDFQIEGMSVGDSLLDYFTEDKIKKNIRNYNYKSNKFYVVGMDYENSFKVYDVLDIHLKTNDKKYIIKGIAGVIYFEKKINDCYKQKDDIASEFSQIFKTTKMNDAGTKAHPADKTGESKTTDIYFDFKSGDSAKVSCFDWSEKMTKKFRYGDHLRVSIVTNELSEWLKNEAF